MTPDEIHLRGATLAAQISAEMQNRVQPVPRDLDVWNLRPDATYSIPDDNVVVPIMAQLGVPNLFANMIEHDEVHSLVAFDNHPTHWIALHLWKGHKSQDGNGLLFEAMPKVSTSRAEMMDRLKKQAKEMKAKETVSFSQLPAPKQKLGAVPTEASHAK